MKLHLWFVLALTVCQKCHCSREFVHHFEIQQNSIPLKSHGSHTQTRFRRDADSTCQSQETTFLTDVLQKKTQILEKRVFQNDSNTGMALAWAGTHGTMIVVTSQESFGIATGASNIYRTENYGLTFENITSKLTKEPTFIRKHAGIFRHTDDTNRVYLVSVRPKGTVLYITEDSGKSFVSVNLDFQIDGQLHFNPKNKDYLMASSSVLTVKKIFVSEDNGKNWRRIADSVQVFKWGFNSKVDTDQTIYAAIDSANTHPFFATFFVIKYDLKKSTDLGKSWTILMKDVISFGHQDKFLYVAVPEKAGSSQRKMLVSTDGGATWDRTYLPTMNGERFFSVLDMNEGLVFMHVDNPGDTGHGTLYTSSGKGMLYSESLQKHLYPNYGDSTDFFRVQSMRGVYLASQMRDDNSIHTVISYNLGGTWHPVPKPEGSTCKDPKKECALQIHGTYSRSRGIISELPLSVPSATGVILAHGHVADALQTTKPDVYITTDGGYKWRKALDGPHHYHIADSGSLLVAVPADTTQPKLIKFSTDEGRCWHTYDFIDKESNETIMFTGLLTEPGSKALTVSIWGYKPDTRKWTTFIIDFQKIFKKKCDTATDYDTWVPHETSNEKGNIQGCLLGNKETFKKVKKDSWCYNGADHPLEHTGEACTCVRDDYECDYGFYRPDGRDDCVEQPNFNLPKVDVCKQGHEEQVITQGYRKIPNDKCVGGFSPNGKLINLGEQCASKDEGQIAVEEVPQETKDYADKYTTYKVNNIDISTETADGKDTFHSMTKAVFQLQTEMTDSTAVHAEQKTHNASAIVAVFVIVALIVTIMVGFFVYKYIILRKHNVTYRYSLLNQNDGVSYDDELENALTKAGLYHDSDDEELNSPAVKKQNDTASNGGSRVPKEQRPSRSNQLQSDIQSYHDDSDVDMIQ
ncbi:sortilin-like isoform X2 [Mytilus edulis]|uniref:sortilin-like isoform X2 n=1 Tax=Mytilus edulis TaxID=6550 RepID=UPI0039F136B7